MQEGIYRIKERRDSQHEGEMKEERRNRKHERRMREERRNSKHQRDDRTLARVCVRNRIPPKLFNGNCRCIQSLDINDDSTTPECFLLCHSCNYTGMSSLCITPPTCNIHKHKGVKAFPIWDKLLRSVIWDAWWMKLSRGRGSRCIQNTIFLLCQQKNIVSIHIALIRG